MFTAGQLRQPASGLTHLAAAILSVAGLVLLVRHAAQEASGWHVLSFSVYGTSLVLLFTASSLYHLLPLSPRGVTALRRLDHSMVGVLIAGTYTPICVLALRGAWGWSLLGVIWALALAAAVLKLVWIDVPRRLSVGIYLLMGWLGVVAIFPLTAALPPAALAWLGAGGLLYSFGAVIYACKRPDPIPDVFGFHEIWHLFVIAGSAAHWWMMMGHLLHLKPTG